MNVLVSPDHRIRLLAQPVAAANAPELEAVFVGAAAATTAFDSASTALAAAAALGFSPAAGDTTLNNLPLAFADIGSFVAAFPGDDSWLARAVRDYFAAGGLRAWVVRVDMDPAAPLDAYASASPAILATEPQNGIAIAAQIPTAGLLVLPDLEYFCLAATQPPKMLPPPPPVAAVFRPIKDFIAPAPAPIAQPTPTTTIRPIDVLTRVSGALAVLRPDMLCLFALPVGADSTQSQSVLTRRAIAYVHGDLNGAVGTDMPQIQALAPLVQDV